MVPMRFRAEEEVALMQLTIDRPVIDRDAELLEALRRRDGTAAERLVSTFGDRAYRLAIGITGKQQDAEEVVQDVFWNVIRKIDTFRGDATLGSWIYRITANAAYQRRRSGSRRRNEISLDEILPSFHKDGHYADPIVDWSTELDDPAVQTELRSVLTSVLEELPDHYRAVMILHERACRWPKSRTVSTLRWRQQSLVRTERASFCASVSEDSCPAQRLGVESDS